MLPEQTLRDSSRVRRAYSECSSDVLVHCSSSAHPANLADVSFSKFGDRPVPVLLLRRGPTTVTRLVVAIRIDPIERMAGWPFAHVGKEGQEAVIVKPPITDPDTSPAVMWVSDVLRVRAARLHRSPALVGAAAVAVRSSPVPVSPKLVVVATSATTAVTRPECAATNFALSSAVAPAEPSDLIINPILRGANNRPRVESLSSDVLKRSCHIATVGDEYRMGAN